MNHMGLIAWAKGNCIRGLRPFAITVLCCAVVVFSGCASWPQELPPKASFKGIEFLGHVSSTGQKNSADPIRVLYIHGMGIHEFSDPDALLRQLTTAMGLHQVPPSQLAPPNAFDFNPPFLRPYPILIGAGSGPPAELYQYDFTSGDGKMSLSFSFLLWSPLTTGLKVPLANPSAPEPASINKLGKDMMNNNISDAMIYAGTYRKVIRPVVEQALCLFIGGKTDVDDVRKCHGGSYNGRTAVITHSLGGYILMDAYWDLSGNNPTKPAVPAEQNASFKLLLQLDEFFMLANQLPLLNLTTLTSNESAELTNKSVTPTPHNELMNHFLREWSAVHRLKDKLNHSSQKEAKLELVAISDPNDILSYVVSNDSVKDSNIVTYNVFLPNVETNWFHIFANPVVAHTGYMSNDTDMKIIVCGMTEGVINSCGDSTK